MRLYESNIADSKLKYFNKTLNKRLIINVNICSLMKVVKAETCLTEVILNEKYNKHVGINKSIFGYIKKHVRNLI